MLNKAREFRKGIAIWD